MGYLSITLMVGTLPFRLAECNWSLKVSGTCFSNQCSMKCFLVWVDGIKLNAGVIRCKCIIQWRHNLSIMSKDIPQYCKTPKYFFSQKLKPPYVDIHTRTWWIEVLYRCSTALVTVKAVAQCSAYCQAIILAWAILQRREWCFQFPDFFAAFSWPFLHLTTMPNGPSGW